MAFDRVEPPDLWASTQARLLYQLACAWSGGKAPRFSDFLPASMTRGGPPAPMDEAAILSAFGIRPRPE